MPTPADWRSPLPVVTPPPSTHPRPRRPSRRLLEDLGDRPHTWELGDVAVLWHYWSGDQVTDLIERVAGDVDPAVAAAVRRLAVTDTDEHVRECVAAYVTADEPDVVRALLADPDPAVVAALPADIVVAVTASA